MWESIAIALYALGLFSTWVDIRPEDRARKPLIALAVAAAWPLIILGVLAVGLALRIYTGKPIVKR